MGTRGELLETSTIPSWNIDGQKFRRYWELINKGSLKTGLSYDHDFSLGRLEIIETAERFEKETLLLIVEKQRP